MNGLKNTYYTFEFRFIRMVENPAELAAVAWLLDKWTCKMADFAAAGLVLEPEIKRKDLAEMAKVGTARKIVRKWLDGFSIDATMAANLMKLFDRNYRTRILHGEMR
jgi:hypothetical protein